MIILTSLPCHSIEIFSHHSNIIPISFWCNFIIQDLTYFCYGMSLEWKMLSLLTRFLLEWVGTKHCPPLREWQERGQNDHQSLRKEGQTARKEGQTTLDSQSFPFSFLSFGPPSSFEGPSESFLKDRNFWNDLRMRSKRGEGWEKSRVISPSERVTNMYYSLAVFSTGTLIWFQGNVNFLETKTVPDCEWNILEYKCTIQIFTKVDLFLSSFLSLFLFPPK